MIKYVLLLTTALSLTACSTGPLFESWDEQEPNTADTVIPNGSVYKIEKPYEINGVWYYPAEDYSYSDKGIASWYTPNSGRTANGEEYIATEMTARHKTLPLPSIVRITNLENNKSIIARVNDRGPMVNNRLIDVSQKAAQELGFPVAGTTMVQVEVLPKESQEIRDALLASGRVYTEALSDQDLSIVPPMPIPQSEPIAVSQPEPIYVEQVKEVPPTQPAQSVKPVPVGSTFIQLGAYGDPANAARVERAASQITAVTTAQKTSGGRVLTVIKAGPYANRAEAEQALRQLQKIGYRDAYISK